MLLHEALGVFLVHSDRLLQLLLVGEWFLVLIWLFNMFELSFIKCFCSTVDLLLFWFSGYDWFYRLA
jgi:hypothetical protein